MHISDYGLLRFIMNNATALQQLISHSVSEIAKPQLRLGDSNRATLVVHGKR